MREALRMGLCIYSVDMQMGKPVFILFFGFEELPLDGQCQKLQLNGFPSKKFCRRQIQCLIHLIVDS